MEILHESVLMPLLAPTTHPVESGALSIGGGTALEELQYRLARQPQAIGFTLCPLSAQQLIEAADSGRILPPKATCISPKLPFGLLLYHPDIV